MFKSAYAFTIIPLLAVVHKVPASVGAIVPLAVPKPDVEVSKWVLTSLAVVAAVAAVTNESK